MRASYDGRAGKFQPPRRRGGDNERRSSRTPSTTCRICRAGVERSTATAGCGSSPPNFFDFDAPPQRRLA
jgi:hypothetical protein